MVKNLIKSYFIICLIGVMAGFITTRQTFGESAKNEPNELNLAKAKERPIIIWHRSGERTGTTALETVLSSGLITHVNISYRSRSDGAWNSNRSIRRAIEIVKKSDAKLIWCRGFGGCYKIENARYSDLFDSNHYIREIQNIKAEAKAMGADFTALDTEPYGNSPMRPYMVISGKLTPFLSNKQHQQLKRVIRKVIRTTGKVDFIAPAGFWGYPGHNHPYDILATLGKLRIAENTYYDNARQRNAIKYPYEIFGAYLNTTKRNDNSPHNLYFLTSEIFERSELWSNRKGVFIYTKRAESLAVAKELAAYSKTLPFRDSAKPSEPSRR